MKFEEKLIKLRKQKSLSQEDLADVLNISRQAVSRWESGATLPDAPNLIAISDLFGVSIDYLLRDDYEQNGTVVNSSESKNVNLQSKRYPHKMFLVAFILWIVSAVCTIACAVLHFITGDIKFGCVYVSLACVDIVFAIIFFTKYLKNNKSDKK